MGDLPANVGNFKGVMLCSRPAVPDVKPAVVQSSGGLEGRVAFISTIIPPEQLGLNPIKKLYPHSRAPKQASDSVTWRHKRWLQDFQTQKALQAQRAKIDEAEQKERKRKFAEKQANKRAKIRGTDTKVIAEMPNGQVKDMSQPATREIKAQPQKEQEKTKKQSSVKKTKETKKMPAWALSEKQAEDFEDEQVDDLIDFTKNLDLDKFMDDMEVREALRFVKERVDDMERKDRLYAPKAEFGSEEERAAAAAAREAERLPLLDERHTARSASGSRMEDRPEWNDSVRVDDMRSAADAALEGGRMKHVHSSRSMQKVIERVASQAASASKAEPQAQLAVQPPTVTVTSVEGKRGTQRASGLPFLYRHPAI